MKDQVREAKLNVRANLLKVLIGIVRDKPTAMRLVSNGCSPLLHLAWVMDINLVLCRQGQCRPDTRICQRPLAIGIKRNFDLNGAFDVRGITASRPRALLECR